MLTEDIMSDPVVSIIINNYNYEKFLEKSIQSALHQTWTNVEVIVVDDGSTDNSRKVLQQYDHVVRVIYKPNGGQASAINAGYNACQGDIICFLDSDDEFASNKVERIVSLLKDQTETSAIVIHAMQLTSSDGKKGEVIPQLLTLESGNLRQKVLRRGGRWSHMPTSALSITRPLADMVFPIPEDFRISADSFIYTLSPLVGHVYAIPEPLTDYRIHSNNSVGLGITTVSNIQNYLLFMERSIQAVNARLHTLGSTDQLNLGSNLNYKEQKYFLSLLTSRNTGAHFKAFISMMRDTWRDELYSVIVKLVYLSTLIAIILPPGVRSRFITLLTRPSSIKTRIQSITRILMVRA